MKKGNKKDNTIDLVSISLGITVILGLLLFIFISMSIYTSSENEDKIWNVHLSRVVNVNCSLGATCSNPVVYNNSTSIGDYSIEVTSVSDNARYELTVVNEGKVDAELVGIIMNTPKCVSTHEESEAALRDQELICSGVKYRLVDEDNNTIGLGDIIEAGESKKYYLLITNDLELTDSLILSTVKISNLNVSLDYAQA